jgi:hypothetical protein
MARTFSHLHARDASNVVTVNAMPFSDWLAHVDARIIRNSNGRYSKTDAPQMYWFGLYNLGQSWLDVADEFLEDVR